MITTASPRRRAPAGTELRDALLLGLALLLMVVLTTPALRVPGHVDRVTVSNPGPWLVWVDLVDPDGRPRVALGPVGPGSEQSFHEVIDQGVEWVFRFSYSGAAARLHRARAQLEAGNWQVTVPVALADELRAAGVPEPRP